jgi:ParB family chromosome partitioning protein
MLKIVHIHVADIIPPAFDSRTSTNPEKDAELLESVRQYGVLEPISVKKLNGKFEIIFGHRRFRAACAAPLPTIPAMVLDADEQLTEILKCHENIHQLPLSHIDQASHFCYMRVHFHMTETEIAKLVGKSIPYVSQHLSLLESGQNIITAVQDGAISFSVARELVQVENSEEQNRLLRIAADNGATAAVVHSWVREANRDTAPPGTGPVYVPDDGQQSFNQNPTFPCQSCENQTPISHLMIVRLCQNCHRGFMGAISEIKKDEAARA